MGLPSPLIAMNALWRSFLGRNYSPATDNTAYDTESLPPLPIISGGTGANSAMAAMNKLVPNVAASTDIINSLAGFVGTGNETKKITAELLKAWLGIVSDKATNNFPCNARYIVRGAASVHWISPITGKIKVTLIGGGGGGGYGPNGFGGGGGGAGNVVVVFLDVNQGERINILVGMAGSGSGSNGTKGVDGGDTIIKNSVNEQIAIAEGGKGGLNGTSSFVGVGGSSPIGAIFTGPTESSNGNGGAGFNGSRTSGGLGGSTSIFVLQGAASVGPPGIPGSGGNGGFSSQGKNGQGGAVMIEYQKD